MKSSCLVALQAKHKKMHTSAHSNLEFKNVYFVELHSTMWENY